MSLAVPLLSDLTKATSDVLYGTLQGEGAFTSGAQIKTQSVTAGGVILNASTKLSAAAGVAAPSLTLMSTPTKSLLLMSIFDATGSVTGCVTASSLFHQPGLQATFTATPPQAPNKAVSGAAGSASLTLDYTHPAARLRAILSPSDPAHLLASATKPTAQLSGTTTLGPCVVGGRLGADAAAGKLTGWGVGLSYTWLAASRPAAAAGEAAAADKPVERLSAQQWGLLVSDDAAGTRTATISAHQLLSGGRVELAAEYTLPIHTPAPSVLSMHNRPPSLDGYHLTVGVSRRLETGGLVKARVQHTGLLSLLYQQSLPGVGQAGATCSLDPTQAHKVVPSFGLSLTV